MKVAATRRRLFYWCHVTSRQPFETGVERVTRRLGLGLAQLGFDIVPIGYDAAQRLVEVIGSGSAAFETFLAEEACLGGPGERPLMVVPELTADLVASGVDPVRLAAVFGMRVLVLVHDMIPVKPDAPYTADVIAAFTAYYAGLAYADALLTTTRSVAAEVRLYLEGHALRVPPIVTVPLPAQFAGRPRVSGTKRKRVPGDPLTLVAVGSWERRKNLPGLLRALRRAQQASDVPIRLTIVGRRGSYRDVDAEVDVLLASAVDVTVAGAIADAPLAALIVAADATVFASLEEGFGLPIGESLWLGTPCLCHSGSVMAEVAPGGGTSMVDMSDEGALAEALLGLTREPGLLTRLGDEALARPLTSWSDYAAAVLTVLRGSGARLFADTGR